MTLLIVIFSILLILNVICLLGNILFFQRGCEKYQMAIAKNDETLVMYKEDQQLLQRAIETNEAMAERIETDTEPH